MALQEISMEKQIIIFEIENEPFEIDIAAVEGNVKIHEITSDPQSAGYMEGITNLRGTDMPLIDLEKRVGIPPRERTRDSSIVVVNMDNLKIGMIAVAGL